MTVADWHKAHFQEGILGRYLPPKTLEKIVGSYRDVFEISVIGHSENGLPISALKIGTGNKKILAWSQMHGNETTTTKAVLDLLKFLAQEEYLIDITQYILSNFCLYVVPMLNPDGALNYTRENINHVDLNRDAKNQSQSEIRALFSLFEKVSPELCLNLHDQRTIYGLSGRIPATVSFLAPASNEARDITKSRSIAMSHITAMFTQLNEKIPGHIGRYDDTFNENCTGDCFQSLGVPTILFEAGHIDQDYFRNKTRHYIFLALIELFSSYNKARAHPTTEAYFKIPENNKNFKDVILRNARINSAERPTDIAIMYREELEHGEVRLIPYIEKIGELEVFWGHEEVEVGGSKILLNSYENVFENEKVSIIVDKYSKNRVFFNDSYS